MNYDEFKRKVVQKTIKINGRSYIIVIVALIVPYLLRTTIEYWQLNL